MPRGGILAHVDLPHIMTLVVDQFMTPSLCVASVVSLCLPFSDPYQEPAAAQQLREKHVRRRYTSTLHMVKVLLHIYVFKPSPQLSYPSAVLLYFGAVRHPVFYSARVEWLLSLHFLMSGSLFAWLRPLFLSRRRCCAFGNQIAVCSAAGR